MAYTSKKQSSMKKGMKKNTTSTKGGQSSAIKGKNHSGQKGGQSSITQHDKNQDSLTEDSSMEKMAEDYNTPDEEEGIGGTSL